MIFLRIVFFTALITSPTWLSACTPPNRTGDDTRGEINHLGGIITDDTVSLSKDAIFSIKPERYQPSFELRGVILPSQQTDILANQTGVLSHALITTDKTVNKNDVLFIIVPKAATPKIPANTTSNQVDEQANEPANDTADTEITSPITDSPTNDNPATELEPDVLTTDVSHALPTDEVATPAKPAIIKAPFAGKITALYSSENKAVNEGDRLATLEDERLFEFVSVLPASFEKHLKIGMVVNFTDTTTTNAPSSSQAPAIANKPNEHQFSGQISNITHTKENKISVITQIHPSEGNNITLTKGMQVAGRVDYGQIQVGALVPRQTLISNTLAVLDTPPHKPATPMQAQMWVIKQDATLSLTTVEVIEYQPTTQQYLVYGIGQDSLITSATLPAKAHGMAVTVD